MFIKYRLLFIAIFFSLFLMLAGSYQIATNPRAPVFDQFWFLELAQSSDNYNYHFENAISYLYFLKIINLVTPADRVKQDTWLRIFALFLYIGTGSLLFYSMLERRPVGFFIFFITLLFSARFAFLWNSVEVFSGSALMMVLYAIFRKTAFPITAIFVVIFAFSKPDLICSGTIVGLFLAYQGSQQKRKTLKNVFIFFAFCFLMLLPCFILNGTDALKLRERGFITFKQHYASLVSPHQIVSPRPHPWQQKDKYYAAV